MRTFEFGDVLSQQLNLWCAAALTHLKWPHVGWLVSYVETRSACCGGPKPRRCPKWIGMGAEGVLTHWRDGLPRVSCTNATTTCTSATLFFAHVQQAFGPHAPKQLLHPLLTTLGTFEVSDPCSKHFEYQLMWADKVGGGSRTYHLSPFYRDFGISSSLLFVQWTGSLHHKHKSNAKHNGLVELFDFCAVKARHRNLQLSKITLA